jgi:hypothetical protein
MLKRSSLMCLIFVAVGASWVAAAAPASRRWLPAPEVDPDPKIPTLQQVVGHDWARDISSYAEMERYLHALAKVAGDRAALIPYGRTYEGRTLYYLVLASPDNLPRREELRAANLALADPRNLPPEKARQLLAQTPAIIWLSFAIHGNETSATEAALLTAYHLLADRRPQTRALLANLVVIIDPLENPDGHERFVNVFRETRGVFADAQPLATEHTERWPSGRFNHYLFDMNRDWFLQSQRESRARVAAYLHWQPHLYVDAHEMGPNSTYFFSPEGVPVNPFFLPRQLELLDQLARQLAGRFDACGFPYTTREMFNTFYPGYGSVWPTLQGGLGILWEQAGVRGLVIQREDERQLRFSDAVRHHYVSALATVEFAAEHHQTLVSEYCESRRRGIQLGREGPVRHFFLLPEERARRAATLADSLRRNGIEVRRVTKLLQTAATSARTGRSEKRTIPVGSFHVPVAQPAAHLVRSLLDRTVNIAPAFLQRQLQRQQDRFPDEFYDITAWSLPLAYDTECLAADGAVAVESTPWDGAADKGEISGRQARVAYLVADHDSALPAVAAWLRQGLRVHVADRELRLGDIEYPRGTLVLRTHENPPELHAVLERSAREHGLRIRAADTGMAAAGSSLGSPYVRWIRPPQVALVVDRPASYTAGHTWHLFDQVLRYPITRVAGQNLGRLPLAKYNVLVLPDGDYSGRDAPSEKDAARIRQWVSDGGTLIVVKGAIAWATKKTNGLLSTELRKKPVASKPTPKDTTAKDAGGKPAAEAADEATAEPPAPAPGAFLSAQVFREHWLTFGCRDTLDVFFRGNVILSPPAPSKGRSLVTFRSKTDALSSGFCWPETLELIAETPYVMYEPVGEGHIVAFTDDPNYRAMCPATQRLFLNAVLFGPGH